MREAIGGGLYDYEFDEPWLVVDVKVQPGSRTPDLNTQICDPERPTTCVLGGPGWHRWEFMLLPGETPEAITNEDVIEALIRRWGCGPVTMERKAVYRFHGLVANRWRSGRVLDRGRRRPPDAARLPGRACARGCATPPTSPGSLSAVLDGPGRRALARHLPGGARAPRARA